MDLTRGLLRLATPRALVVAACGSTAIRLAVEREMRQRGWADALTPANADILVVCGSSEDAFEETVDRLWDQIPSPRTLVRMMTPDAVARQLDQAQTRLRDVDEVRTDAVRRGDPAVRSSTRSHDMADMDASMDMDMNMDTNMDMGMDMSMDMPGGIPMADRGADRDGLTLDQLHVALGPALADWPSGLIVRLVLQGDIVQTAEPEALGDPVRSSFWLDAEAGTDERLKVRAAAAADSLQRFLSVAGWENAAGTGRWLRDELLASAPGAAVNPRFARWLRRVRRSRVLHWSMSGVGQAVAEAPAGLRGDVWARCVRWTEQIAAVIDAPGGDGHATGAAWGRERAEHAHAALSMLPAVLAGQELAAARLIVASFDPDLEALHAHALGGSHG